MYLSNNNYMLDPEVRGGEKIECLSVKNSKLQLGVVVQVFDPITQKIGAGGYLLGLYIRLSQEKSISHGLNT